MMLKLNIRNMEEHHGTNVSNNRNRCFNNRLFDNTQMLILNRIRVGIKICSDYMNRAITIMSSYTPLSMSIFRKETSLKGK